MATKISQQPQPLMKPNHFFKIITDHNLHEGKLMIPNKFVEKYGEGLANNLFLKTPNGAEWEMDLKKHDGKIWFQKGWKEFAEYHSLAHGHLLVFRCETTSQFQVHIFGLSTLEINYPSKTIEAKTVSNNEGNQSPKEENLEYHRPGQKRKDNSSFVFLQTYQMGRSKRVKKEGMSHIYTKSEEKSKTTANQVSALDRASSFQSCHPFFCTVMHPSYIGAHFIMNLPSMFCRRHFALRKKKRLINLQVLNGKVWPAKYVIHQQKMTNTRFRLSRGGWREFVKHNKLKVGDVCVFELINRTKLLTFLVHIFRETESSNCSTSKESSQMRTVCQGQRKAMKTITATKNHHQRISVHEA